MSTDKRSVHTDALATLGTIIGESEKRDAIHIAVELVTAAHALHPGDDVGFVDGCFGACDNPVGIVDPFLKDIVKKGQRFWLLVYPRQIQSLRHVWSHPAFGDEPQVTIVDGGKRSRSEKWLRDFCSGHDCPNYDTVMELIEKVEIPNEEYAQYGGSSVSRYDKDYLFFVGTDAHSEIPPEFWDHVENVLGRTVPFKPNSFACTC